LIQDELLFMDENMAMGKKKHGDSLGLGFQTSVPNLGSARRAPARSNAPAQVGKVDDEIDTTEAGFLRLLEEDLSKTSERVTAYTANEATEDEGLLARIKAYKKG
jgi:hypothetical protein